jgi:arginyl-tRNA--protein-N-Asp/Glu arginylyltransferase
MQSLFCFQSPPSTCGYLPDQIWQLEYEHFASISPSEYMERMQAGWRRFGHSLFHNRCPDCTRCQSLRVLVEWFQPTRAQRRCWKLNAGSVRVCIGRPSVSPAKLRLYDRFHAFQTETKGWPLHPAKDAASYAEAFVENPFPTQEWCYYLDDRLVGVGYVDDLPGGMSAIYFFYDPDERDRSLGTFNVLSVIDAARSRGIPHVYLGYFVEGCQSMEYKATFGPNQVRGSDGAWHNFR